nr:hypothetical protein [Escherichia coli]
LLLVKMRDFYIQNNMTNGKPAWIGCEIIVDIPEEKISINFQYDDLTVIPAPAPGSPQCP